MSYFLFVMISFYAGSFSHESLERFNSVIKQPSSFENDSLLALRRKAEKIDSDLNNFNRLTKDIYNRILETEAKDISRHGSSVLEGYVKNDSLFKIVATYEGDRDTYISQYYFLIRKYFMF